jgi:hypothetical protein
MLPVSQLAPSILLDSRGSSPSPSAYGVYPDPVGASLRLALLRLSTLDSKHLAAPLAFSSPMYSSCPTPEDLVQPQPGLGLGIRLHQSPVTIHESQIP